MIATAVLEHQIAGRVRLKIPSKRGDVAFFEALVQALSNHAAIADLVANPLTGGVVIRHSGAVQPILSMAADQGIFEVRPQQATSSPSQPPPRKEEQNPVGLLDTIAFSLAGLGAFQVARGPALGSASENFWNAYGAQRVLGSRTLVAAFAGLGVYQLLRGELLGSASSLFFYALVARHLAAEERAAGEARSPTDEIEAIATAGS
jgi:hypothetical protein